MYTYIFIGKLEPKNLIKDFNLTSTIELKQPDFGIDGTLEIKIKNSRIKILYKTTVDHTLRSSANLTTLKNFVQDTVELTINLYGYVNSLYLDVYILHIKCKSLGVDYIFGVKGEQNINKSGAEIQAEFNKLFSIFNITQNSSLKEVFSDFHKAIKYPAATAQFCFRAIEVIRINYFENAADIDTNRKKENGWDALRAELNYTRQDFNQIMQYGIPNRHGIYPSITYPVREQIMNFTRDLINRFISIKLGIY